MPRTESEITAAQSRMTFYHATLDHVADEIVHNGFRDATGFYLTSQTFTGVWISNVPLDENEGAKGGVLLAVEIDPSLITQYEWIEERKPYREFLVPAELLNTYATVRRLTEDEADAAIGARFGFTP